MVLNEKKLRVKPRKLYGRIMFPTTHDLMPEHVDIFTPFLQKWLAEGNEFLIVTKPHFEVIKSLCHSLAPWRKLVTFRFTMGSYHDAVLKFWEPGAPLAAERDVSLSYAFTEGFNTSVSCEPYLDGDIYNLVKRVRHRISDTIWIGKMNKIDERVNVTGWTLEDMGHLADLRACQTDKFIKERVYGDLELQHDSKVRWKDSIKRVVGLPEEEMGR
jgi:DNA repair photolyase